MKVLACAMAASAIMRLALEMSPSSDDPDCDSVHGPSSQNLCTQAGASAEPPSLVTLLRSCSVPRHVAHYESHAGCIRVCPFGSAQLERRTLT